MVRLDGLKMNRALKRDGRQKWQQTEIREMGIFSALLLSMRF